MKMDTEVIIRWLSFVSGMVFLFLFSFRDPNVFSPQVTILLSGLLFGPSVISVFKGGKGGRNDQ